MTPTEAFDLIVDKTRAGEPFLAVLVARAAKGDVIGFLTLESWIKKQGFETVIEKRILVYRPVKKDVEPRERVVRAWSAGA